MLNFIKSFPLKKNKPRNYRLVSEIAVILQNDLSHDFMAAWWQD